jgi:hypothetical protein
VAENDEPQDEGNGGSIDYDAKQSEIDKAKQKARDEDAQRLAAEHE